LELIAHENSYNPVLELLGMLPDWDGRDRLPDLYNALHIRENDAMSKLLIKKFMVQAISLQFNDNPDTAYGGEGVLVLKGLQGVGKSRLAAWFAMSGLHELCSGLCKNGVALTNNKDSSIAATETWIAELGELGATISLKNQDTLKAFVTANFDEIRKPYGREAEIACRRTVFMATVNDERFLIDETGSRRWWVVELEEEVDWNALQQIDQFQIWKQIEVYAREDPQSFRLSTQEREEMQVRNGAYGRKLTAQEEIEDILMEATEHPQEYSWENITVSAFKEHYKTLDRYSVFVIGRVINKLLPDSSQRNKHERTRRLPIPRRHIVYPSPGRIPPEAKPVREDPKKLSETEVLKH
jgi:predicted P-loop ATPase